MPVECAVEHQAHQMRHVQQRPRREEVVPMRRVAHRVDRDQLERRLPHQVGGNRKAVARSRFVQWIEMRAAERDPAGLRRHQDLGHVRVACPALDLARGGVRILRGDTDRAAPAPVPVVLTEPHVGQPVVVGGLQYVLGLRQLRIAHRLQHRDAHPGVDQQLLGGEIGVAARDSAARRRGVDPKRHRLVRVRRVIEVRHRRDGVTGRPEPVLPLRGRVRLEHLADTGNGCTSVSTIVTAMSCATESFVRSSTVVMRDFLLSPQRPRRGHLRYATTPFRRCTLLSPATTSSGLEVDQCG